MARNKRKKYAFSKGKIPSLGSKPLTEIINKSESIFQEKGASRALEFVRKALVKFPNSSELLGNAALFSASIGKNKIAHDYFNQAIELESNNSNLYNNYGVFLKKIKKFYDAEVIYKKALNIQPKSPNILLNLGNLYKTIGRYEDAHKCYKESLKLQPNSSKSLFNFAVLLSENFKDFENAIVCYKKALKLKNDYAAARFNLSTLFLRLQQFKDGWSYYDARYNLRERNWASPEINTLEWTGEDISKKVLFIWPEQGVGDEVMFASVLPELSKSNAKIILACDARLVKIFTRSFPFISVIEKDCKNQYKSLRYDFDYQISIGALPKIYRKHLKDFDCYQPYLKTDNILVSKWKKRYKKLPHNLNIGISWHGGPNKEIQKLKSISLEGLLPILKLPANFINLQYGDHSDEIKALKNKNHVHLYDWTDADPMKDLDNFAAQVKTLDLVVSVSNTTVHFSGALGTRTLLMLPFHADWRWAEDRNDSYWYPNLFHLYRQPQVNDWESVIDSVAEAVKEKIKKIT